MYFTISKTANDDSISFTPITFGNQKSQGIYFVSIDELYKFIYQGDFIKEILLPIKNKDLKIAKYDNSYYANMVIVHKTYNIVDFLLKYKDDLNPEFYREIAFCKSMKAPLLKELSDYLDWDWVSAHQILDEQTLREFADKVNWKYCSWYQKLSPELINETTDLLDWQLVSSSQNLTEELISTYHDKLNWSIICSRQKLSEDFLRKYSKIVDWNVLSKYQQLSEKIIEEFSDNVNWENISENQKLSREFIEKHKDKLVKNKLLTNKNIKLSDSIYLKNTF